MKDLVSVADLTSEEIDQLIKGALVMKKPTRQTHLEGPMALLKHPKT